MTPKNFIKLLSIIIFVLSTITVASICYEGMILKWLSFVGISIFVIFIGIIMTLIFGKNIPKILFLLWEFYILYFYGIVVCKKLWQK